VAGVSALAVAIAVEAVVAAGLCGVGRAFALRAEEIMVSTSLSAMRRHSSISSSMAASAFKSARAIAPAEQPRTLWPQQPPGSPNSPAWRSRSMAASAEHAPPSSGDDILTTICKKRLADVATAAEAVPLAQIATEAERCAPPKSLETACLERPFLVAAEFKRASPSKGDIALAAEIAEQVKSYASGGASIVSVLTEPHWFRGSLADLRAARAALEEWESATGKPRPLVLRKDFVVDSYQIHEARLHGADTVLLIVSWLETVERVAELLRVARGVGMEPFVEVASLEELHVATSAGAKVIGVNNRNLKTFKVDPLTTVRVAAELERTSYAAALFAFSGLKGPDHVVELKESLPNPAILRGVLVGEHLMRCADPGAEVASLLHAWEGEAGRWAAVTTPEGFVRAIGNKPMVKICGVCSASDAALVCRSGASFVGMILCPGTPRTVEPDEACLISQQVRRFRETDPSSLLGDRSGTLLDRMSRVVRAAKQSRPLTVGVFRDQSAREVAEIATRAQIDLVQLHGDEAPAEFGAFPWPIIKVLHVDPAADGEGTSAKAAEWEATAALFIMDTQVGGARGGTGVAFDWSVVPRVASYPVGVAGGLTPSNVREAIRQSHGWLMDVSSGVESSKRVKSLLAVAEFVSVVHSESL
jgi:anthranilate synthase / indole-3-glycerol phosphate synthase / phosphoribosylanthranilate isomerase